MDKKTWIPALRVRFDNVNFNSSSGPNSFALKLANHFFNSGINVITDNSNADVQLSFIQSNYKHDTIVQRLDGIYFNSEQDWVLLNQPIKSTYDKSAAVIYQSEFNKTLTEKYFGVHPNGTVIHNGTDVDAISKIQPLQHGMLDGFDKVWCCASSWRPHKRLKENVLYFLEHSSEKDCLVIAGSNPDFEIKKNEYNTSIICAYVLRISLQWCITFAEVH